MNVIIDSSAVIAAITNSASKARLVELTNGVDLISPTIMQNEVLKAFSLMHKRQWLRFNQVKAGFQVFQSIPIRYVTLPLDEIAELAINLKILVNNAAYIYCARKYKAPLLTLDPDQIIAANKAGIKVLEV